MERAVLSNYLINGQPDIDKMLDDFYGYIYIIVKNGVYTRDINSDNRDYNILHDYLFYYEKGENNIIRIAVSEIERPLRDYFIGEGEKISKIGDAKLTIYQWNQMYIVNYSASILLWLD